MSENQDKLFDEFPPIATGEWEALIHKDLKGADYEKRLIWNTIDGLSIKPYYRSENIKDAGYLHALPGQFPYTRGNRENNRWEIRQKINADNVIKANASALKALEKGADAICFALPGGQDNLHKLFPDQGRFSQLVKNINIEKTALHFELKHGGNILINFLKEEIRLQKKDPANILVSFDHDPLGYFTLHGNFFAAEEDTWQQIKLLADDIKTNLPAVRFIGIHGQYFHNSGASIVQELAFSLSMANEYLSHLSHSGQSVDDIAPGIHFTFSAGANYFLEIAKIRAARWLWAHIVEAYKPANDRSMQMYIHIETSRWNQTIYDAYVNMLRNTTEGMSAVIGGADALTIVPFDEAFSNPNEFSERTARNTQIMLKEEAHLDKVADPAAGSYYIENLTMSVIEAVWQLFLSVEKTGGYSAAFKAGIIQKEIKDTAQKRDLNISTRGEILLGTNQYPILKEKAGNIHATENNSAKSPAGKPIAEPLRSYRGAAGFEKLRMQTEHHGKTPRVFLLTYGNLAMRKARSMFATNFFGCAGFDIIDNPGFATIDEGISEAIKSKAEIVVICSSDEEYAAIVPGIIEKLKDKTLLVLAGFPKELVEQFKSAGLQHFIHVRSNVLETLNKIQEIVLR
jgi:methylmalonyl-CoA mutase